MKYIWQLFDSPLWSLVRKEINQILRNRQLIVLLRELHRMIDPMIRER